MAYHYILSRFSREIQVKWKLVLFNKLLPNGTDKAMCKVIQVNESTCVTSVAAIHQVFHELFRHLMENGGEYLMDTKNRLYGFTAVDLTFAAPLYVLIHPPEMNKFWEEELDLHPELVSFGNELQATTAGQHALRMYKIQHLGASFGMKVEIKTAGHDCNPLKGILYSVGIVGDAVGATMWYQLS